MVLSGARGAGIILSIGTRYVDIFGSEGEFDCNQSALRRGQLQGSGGDWSGDTLIHP